MVLQTSCRCLRQVVKHEKEPALIWLNKYNADILNKQLKQQQNITLKELNESAGKAEIRIDRFSRMEKLNVPPIDFYQLKVSYHTLTVKEQPTTGERLKSKDLFVKAETVIIHEQDFTGKETNIYDKDSEDYELTDFNYWLYTISKESFNTLSISCLKNMRQN